MWVPRSTCAHKMHAIATHLTENARARPRRCAAFEKLHTVVALPRPYPGLQGGDLQEGARLATFPAALGLPLSPSTRRAALEAPAPPSPSLLKALTATSLAPPMLKAVSRRVGGSLLLPKGAEVLLKGVRPLKGPAMPLKGIPTAPRGEAPGLVSEGAPPLGPKGDGWAPARAAGDRGREPGVGEPSRECVETLATRRLMLMDRGEEDVTGGGVPGDSGCVWDRRGGVTDRSSTA